MAQQLVLFFQLIYLCIRLGLELLFFSWQVIWASLNKRFLSVFLITLFILTNLISSLFIWQYKQTPKIVVEKEHTLSNKQIEPLTTRLILINEKDLNDYIKHHQDLEQDGIINQAIYLNLSQLTSINDQDQAKLYLEKAKKITPWFALE